MQYQTQERLPISVRVAHTLNRLLTWGMRSEDRKPLLREGLADWEAMAEAHGWRQVVWRAVRGIPSGIWIRLSNREVTSLPAGMALAVIGVGGVAVGFQPSAYPVGFRRFVVVASLGVMLTGVNFVREPRRIVLARYRLAGTLAALGFLGLALTLPVDSQWPYDTPVVETPFVDAAMPISFIVIAIGIGLVVIASFLPGRSWLISLGGLVTVGGIAFLAVAQLAWAFAMAPIDLTASLASVVIGLGALSFVHVLPRLRHMEVVGRGQAKARPDTTEESPT